MKSRVFWDLDGVLRNLAGSAFGYQPPSWDHKLGRMGLVELIRRDPDILVRSKPFKYLSLLNSESIILTVPQKWLWWTSLSYEWCEKYIRNECAVFFVRSPEDKLGFMNECDILIEDNPAMAVDKRVWLIDRPYNRKVKPSVRIRSVPELKARLKGVR